MHILATHAEFIFQHLEERYIKKLLSRGLRKFSRNMIMQFHEEIKSHQVHFVVVLHILQKVELSKLQKNLTMKLEIL